MMQYAMEQIVDLLAVPSPTGFTERISRHLCERLSGMGFSPELTRKGNVVCDLGGEGRPLLISAHVDTLGAMVRAIKETGRLRYAHVGGYADATIETENCLIHTRDGRVYSGAVQSTKASQHVFGAMNKEERTDQTLEIVLDERVKTREEVRALGIEAGDYISWDPRTVLTESGYLKSRHLDDKASSGILLALAKAVSEEKVALARRVVILFTVYEEVGHGASALPEIEFQDMLAVDMGCVGDDLSCDETMVSICCKDSSGPYNYAMTGELIALARREALRYAVDVYPHYASDTEAALFSGRELRHALIGPGVFASHGYERAHREGIENTLKLLLALVAEGPGAAL